MFAKINKGKVVRLIEQPNRGENYLPVVDNDVLPTDFPDFFYEKESQIPDFLINTNHVVMTTTYILKNIESIRDYILNLQKMSRQKRQLGVFMVGDTPVEIRDREDSLIISSLALEPTNFKIGKGQWLNLDIVTVASLKESHRLHIQAAYDWEMAENNKVMSLTSLEGLKDYYLLIKGEL